MSRKFRLAAVAATLSLTLAACGGGGGSVIFLNGQPLAVAGGGGGGTWNGSPYTSRNGGSGIVIVKFNYT